MIGEDTPEVDWDGSTATRNSARGHRIYMALKEWDMAQVDADVVAQRLLGTNGRLSLRTPELDAAESLKAKFACRENPKTAARLHQGIRSFLFDVP